jgi:hypothetical protein
MTIKNLLTAILIIFILSAVGMGLWLYEILKIKGWYSLTWLSEQLYSPFIATLFAVFAFMTPFVVCKQTTAKKIIFSTIILYVISILCFSVGKDLCYALYGRFYFWKTQDIVLYLSTGIILFPSLGIIYWFVTNQFIKKNKKINMLFITIFIIGVIPISIFTIELNKGFSTQSGWVDVVKMGYPIFWITMALGLSGGMSRRTQIISNSFLLHK